VTDLPPGARVVAYLRDSGHSDQERSVTQQRAAVDAYCQAGDLVLVETYADEATPGGTVAGRDAFGRMIDDLRRLAPEPERGERDPAAPDAVLYWDLRRFARDQTDSAFFRADLRRRGYQLLSLADTIPNGDMAPVFEAMLAWKAEEDRRQMSRDIRRGLHDLVSARDEDGEYLNLIGGHPPAGFRADGTWERVQQAWQMRAEGASYADIHRATHLFANLPSYSQMFTRTLYRGDLTYGGRVYEGWITPCVDRATWDAVQARRLPPGKHRARLGTTTYTLSGWLRCGACGLAVTGSTNKTVQGGKTYRYRRYRCTALTNRKRFSTCAFATRAEPLERAVYNALASTATPNATGSRQHSPASTSTWPATTPPWLASPTPSNRAVARSPASSSACRRASGNARACRPSGPRPSTGWRRWPRASCRPRPWTTSAPTSARCWPAGRWPPCATSSAPSWTRSSSGPTATARWLIPCPRSWGPPRVSWTFFGRRLGFTSRPTCGTLPIEQKTASCQPPVRKCPKF